MSPTTAQQGVDYRAALPGGRMSDEQPVLLSKGTGLYGVSASDPAARENYRRLLLQYCKLDTAAMVMIWKH